MEGSRGSLRCYAFLFVCGFARTFGCSNFQRAKFHGERESEVKKNRQKRDNFLNVLINDHRVIRFDKFTRAKKGADATEGREGRLIRLDEPRKKL